MPTPIYSPESEAFLLGALLVEPTPFDAVAECITIDDFYEQRHKVLWQAINDLLAERKAVDIVSVGALIEARKQETLIGGLSYLYDIANNAPSYREQNLLHLARIIKEKSILRKLERLAGVIQETIRTPEVGSLDDIKAFIERLQKELFELTSQADFNRNNTVIELREAIAQSMRRIEELVARPEEEPLVTGTSSGIRSFDEITSGLHGGDLIILAARPGMGKTSLALNIAQNVALDSQNPVLFFSMEMSAESLALRVLASQAKVDMQKIKRGQLTDEEWTRLTASLSTLYRAPIVIDETAALSPQDLRAHTRRVLNKYGSLGLIVVDYLQLMSAGATNNANGFGANRVQVITEITRALKLTAKEFNVPMLVLSQLNRGPEQRPNKRPMISDLRESGSIEQDADLILFIYRDEVYNPTSADKGTAEIIIAKHRNGPTGMIRLGFDGRYTRFEERDTGVDSYF